MVTYLKVTTSAEVYAVIWAKHGDNMKVFATYSAPDGDPYGNSDKCEMYTEWGFNNSDIPLISCRIQWDKDQESPANRLNVSRTYQIFSAMEES